MCKRDGGEGWGRGGIALSDVADKWRGFVTLAAPAAKFAKKF
jgi:hypothetical protein